MRNISIFIVALFIMTMVVSSCSNVEKFNEASCDSSEILYTSTVHRLRGYTKKIEENWNQCNYVVRGKLVEIGESFIRDGVTIDPQKTPAENGDAIFGIRTPYYVEVEEIYKDSTDELEVGDIIEVLQFNGTYMGYHLDNGDPEYEVGHTYLFYIATGFGVNVFDTQATIELYTGNVAQPANANSEASKNFRVFYNDILYDSYANSADIIDKLTELAEDKNGD